MAHVYGQKYKQKGLLTLEEKTIKNEYEIVQLLEAIFLPAELALTHWPGYPKDKDPRMEVITM